MDLFVSRGHFQFYKGEPVPFRPVALQTAIRTALSGLGLCPRSPLVPLEQHGMSRAGLHGQCLVCAELCCLPPELLRLGLVHAPCFSVHCNSKMLLFLRMNKVQQPLL